MKLQKTKIPGLLIIKSKIFKDKRGYLKETFRNNLLMKKNFPFDVMSFSKKKVLRGLHLQTVKSQAKIITVTYGKIYDVAVDLRIKSKTFGRYYSIILSEKNCTSLYIPRGFAHGYYSYEKLNIIYYKLSDYYKPHYESGIIWDDRKLKIKWPSKKPILSKKDKEFGSLDNFSQNFKGL